MKRAIVILMCLAGLQGRAFADQAAVEPDPLEPKSLRDSLYSVSSDDLDPTESLNRISGKIDLGFSAPSQSFESSDHYKPGPFSREKALESS